MLTLDHLMVIALPKYATRPALTDHLAICATHLGYRLFLHATRSFLTKRLNDLAQRCQNLVHRRPALSFSLIQAGERLHQSPH